MNTERYSNPPLEGTIPTRIELVSADGELVLRQFTPEDAREAFDLIDRNREHLSQFGDETAENYQTYESMLTSILHPSNPARLRLGIRHKEGMYMGSINLTPKGEPNHGEIGYYIGKEFGGKGVTTKATVTLTDYAFNNLGYESIFAVVVEGNDGSVRVLEKAGYVETERRLNDEGVVEIILTKTKPAEEISSAR